MLHSAPRIWCTFLCLSAACSGTPSDSAANVVRPAEPSANVAPAPTVPDAMPSGVAPDDVKLPARPHAQAAPAAAPAPAAQVVAGKAPAAPAAAPSKPQPSAAVPAEAPTPTAPTAPKTSVRVPETAHVKVAVPAKLQELLDGDPRMIPWLAATVATIDRCAVQNPGSQGSVSIALTMHENERPTADVGKIPPALSSMFACAMGELMRAKRMPLFTGPEGQKHSLRVQFLK